MPSTLTEQTQTAWRWNQHDFRAMNTTVYTRLFSQTDAAVLHDVARLFISFEKRLSRFRPYSELSRLNAHPHEAFQASPAMLSVVEVALQLAAQTGGLYDPTILSYLEQAGYDRSFEQIANPQPLTAGQQLSPPGRKLAPPPGRGRLGGGRAAASSQSGTLKLTHVPAAPPPFTYRSVQINRPRQTIYRPVGLKLDLGGMGKGWTVDRAADRLQGLGPFLVNAGGDLFAYQAPPGEKGWQIDLTHPLRPDTMMARLYLHHRALASSTIARRRWQRSGQMMHHLINPRTGQPAQTDALSVSVVAERTVLAEVYAKVALILGAEAGLDYLAQLPGVEGLIFTAAGQIDYTPGLEPLLDRVEAGGYTRI